MQRYAITHDGIVKPIRCQTGKGALNIAKGLARQGKANIQIALLDGETLSLGEFEAAMERFRANE